ncbi:MAG TPA: DUF5050 domain-containing protein [Caldisericia bacterium]|nr:DUF5050 domain-containing protein [Caldisericia bacterium]
MKKQCDLQKKDQVYGTKYTNLVVKNGKIFTNRSIATSICLLLMFSLTVCSFGCSQAKTNTINNDEEKIPAINTYGNTTGNITNVGLVAIQGDWIYYSNVSRRGELYKIRVDGSDKTLLCEDNATFINVVGDWVYYSNSFEGEKLYKIRTDGTEKTLLSEDPAWHIRVMGGWIYYSIYDEGAIYKIPTNGGERILLSDGYTLCFPVVTEDWIYCIKDLDSEHILCKIRTDGTDLTSLHDNSVWGLLVAGDWIYYVKHLDNVANARTELCKIRTNGTERTVVYKGETGPMNVAGDWIYFWNEEKDVPKLCKIRTNGTKYTALAEGDFNQINVVGEWIYCTKKVFGDDMYRMGRDTLYKLRIDGTDFQLIE